MKIKKTSDGAGHFLAGIRVLAKTPGLWPYVWIPLVINIAVYLLLSGWGIHLFSSLADRFIPDSHEWYMEIVRVFAWIVFGVVMFITFSLTFFSVANIIASPFNEILSKRYEQLLTGRTVEGTASLLFAVRQELKRIFVYLIVTLLLGILTFLLSPIPGLNLLVALSWVIFSGLLLAFEFLSYVLDRHGFGFTAKLSFIKDNFQTCVGFGIAVYLALLVPILNIAVIPASVVGATHLYIKSVPNHEKDTDLPLRQE